VEEVMMHTPGPWIADDNEGFGAWHIWSRMTPTGSGTPGPLVATVVGDSAETDANAQLIAAAPELLLSLKETFKAASILAEIVVRAGATKYLDEHMDVLSGFGKRANAAIAKAEGRA
jgi:hypothetical protein